MRVFLKTLCPGAGPNDHRRSRFRQALALKTNPIKALSACLLLL